MKNKVPAPGTAVAARQSTSEHDVAVSKSPDSDALYATGRFGQLNDIRTGVAEMVREYPKTAAVAGAAVVGLAAAAAIPAIRGRGRSEEKSGSRKKSGS